MYEDLAKTLREQGNWLGFTPWLRDLFIQAADAIEELTTIATVDVAPVVRCKNCIHIAEHAFVETDEAYCSEHDWCVSETYFCADGEKRTMTDVVPVIRCKDCRYCHYDRVGNIGCFHDRNYQTPGAEIKPYDYCSYAEQRTGYEEDTRYYERHNS